VGKDWEPGDPPETEWEKRQREEEEIAAPYLLEAQAGDWDQLIEYLFMRRELAQSVRVFIAKVLRGKIKRPAKGVRSARKEAEETYIALWAILLSIRHPELRKQKIYDLTTEAIHKNGLNVSRETVATYATKFKDRALNAEKLRSDFEDLWGNTFGAREQTRSREERLAGIIDGWFDSWGSDLLSKK
jgi:hypothetical protein